MNDFVPDGWLTFHDAMKHVSHAMFGAVQTPDQAAESNLLEAANWIRNRAFAGELKAYKLSSGGGMHEIISNKWGNETYFRALLQYGAYSISGDHFLDGQKVLLKSDELSRVIANNSKVEKIDKSPFALPSYIPPYVAYMLRAISALDLRADTKLTKKQIEEWLRQHWPPELGQPSGSKIEYMATFLRRPEDERGGHYSGNR